MDEIFGPANFRNEIVVKRGTKNVQAQFDTIDSLASGHDSVLLYTHSTETRFPKLLRKLDEGEAGSWNNHWRGTDRPTMRYELFGITPERGQWRWSKERTYRAVGNYKVYLERFADTMTIDEYYLGVLESTGEKLDFVRLSSTGKPQHYVPPREHRILSDVWMDVRTAGRATDFEHEKHEELVQRLMEWTTEPGEYVLDSFAGSGTTGAVAHKMGRKWIMVEIGEHAETHIIPRMQRVISGEDQGGISKAVKWQGGGGFTYYTLGESVVGRDTATGMWVLNYSNGPLIEAVCLREGFQIIADGDLHGRKGHHYANVTEEYVTQEYINSLLAQLDDDERLTIYCTWHDRHLSSAPSGRVRIEKIPQALLQKGGRR